MSWTVDAIKIRRQFVSDVCKAMFEARKGFFDVNAAMTKRLCEPAPRFYVTPKHAAEVIYKIIAEGEKALDKYRPLRKQMYLDLYSVYNDFRQKPKFENMPVYKLAEYVVEQQAPQFYIELWTAKNIIKRCCKR